MILYKLNVIFSILFIYFNYHIFILAHLSSSFTDLNRDDYQSEIHSIDFEKLFTNSRCYRAECVHPVIRALESHPNINCTTLPSAELSSSLENCDCCLKRILSFDEKRLLVDRLAKILPTLIDYKCKIVECDDEVKQIMSTNDINARCNNDGFNCRCCVNIQLNSLEIHKIQKKLDTLTASSYSSESDGIMSENRGNKRKKNCAMYSCDGIEVESIKNMDSSIINCLKIGNINKCQCCFNQTLPILERIKYEYELSEIISKADKKEISTPTFSTFRPYKQWYSFPSSLTQKSSTIKSSSSFSSKSSLLASLFPSDDCSYHDCSSDIVAFVHLFNNDFISCKKENSQCKCCLNHNIFSDENLKLNIDKFLSL